jgi:hypothetical protein
LTRVRQRQRVIQCCWRVRIGKSVQVPICLV